jgi:hypothetical protein
MEILNLTMKKPANQLIYALQVACNDILLHSKPTGAKELMSLMEYYLGSIQHLFLRCNRKDFKMEVHVFDTFESFNLIHKKDNILNSITVHFKY